MEITAKIRKIADGQYVCVQIIDGVEVTSDICKIVDEGKTIALPANDSNRKYFNIGKFEESIIASNTNEMALTYKQTVVLGERPSTVPNAKLIAYLPEDLQAEYNAIIARAVAAKEAAKATPQTDLEKAQAKLARAKAAYDKLLADAEGGVN